MTTRAFRFLSFGLWATAFLGLSGPTGCGGDEPSPPDSGKGPPGENTGDETPPGAPRSGSRIEVRGVFLDESLGSELSLYDKELEVPCLVITLAGEAGSYCAPQRFVETFFTDEACSEDSAIGRLPHTACQTLEEGDLAYSIVGSSMCDDRNRLYRLAETIAPPEQLYWRNLTDGTCQPRPAEEDYVFHALEQASPDALVSFTERTDDLPGAEVQVSGLAGDDGSFIPQGLQANGEPCSPTETTEGTRCLPYAQSAFGMGFSDASCTSSGPLVYVSDSVCYELPEYVQLPLNDECPTTDRVLRSSGAPVPAYAGAQCEEQPASTRSFTEMEEVPLSSFTPLGTTWLGEGAIEARVHTSGGVPVGPALEYRIRETGESCWPGRVSDGTVRCVPAKNPAYPGTGHYSDPDCEDELYGGYASATCGEEPSLEGFVYLEGEADACPSTTVRAIRLTAYEGPIYRVDSLTGECTETDGSLTSDTLFVADDEIPLDELPVFSLSSLP